MLTARLPVNAVLAFLLACGVLAAIVGVFLSESLMYLGLIVAAPTYLVLLGRHIDPERHAMTRSTSSLDGVQAGGDELRDRICAAPDTDRGGTSSGDRRAVRDRGESGTDAARFAPEPQTRADHARERRALRQGDPGALLEALGLWKEPTAAFRDIAAVLAFERDNPNPRGAKSERIRQAFHVSETSYYRRLSEIITDHTEEALRVDPVTTNRLRRLADQRAAHRLRRIESIHES